MHVHVKGADLYAYTGGKDFDVARPTAVFVHGVLHDHSVWILQSRYLAHHGGNVLAIDLPGQGRSSGQYQGRNSATVKHVASLICIAGLRLRSCCY